MPIPLLMNSCTADNASSELYAQVFNPLFKNPRKGNSNQLSGVVDTTEVFESNL
ncbi:hypothetical protein IMPERIA89_260020 [Imperialibacter sp. 89]|nr:hypothetical protein IMPERIA89_260020 [Imperialibacter sp. 89]